MIATTNPPPPSFDRLAAQIESLLTGLFTPDPAQAALRGGLSILVFIGAALVIWGLRVLMKALAERVTADEAAAPGKTAGVGRWTLRVARWAVVIVAIVVLLRLWGFDWSDLRQGPLGAALAVAGRLAIILVAALGIIEFSTFAITQVFARISQGARGARRAAQLRTLAPLFIGVITTSIIVMATMMALSEVGVEIGPLIAGAGIVGLAVGFGAQTLVKDFLTGVFLILEDIVSIGDVVRIGECSGVVEEMSLRTIKLRDFDGTLHVFPYSEAQVIHNRTKDFGYAVFELQVSFLSDIEHAIAVTKAVAAALAKDPEFAPQLLAPAEVVGVDAITDNAVVIKGRIKTRPGDQWRVARAFNMRIKQAFDAEGVMIEHRHAPVQPYEAIGDLIADGAQASRRTAGR